MKSNTKNTPKIIPAVTQPYSAGNTEMNPLIQLHIAEYQMLTTRCTYWSIMPTALWPILIGILLLMTQVQAIIKNREILGWGAAIFVQIVVLIHYWTVTDYYQVVYYIENKLRQNINAVIGEQKFWEYESYLKSIRTNEPLVWEYWPLMISILATVSATIFLFPPFIWINFTGFIICVFGNYFSIKKAIGLSSIRKRW